MQGCSSWGDKTRCDPVHYSNLYLLGRHFKPSGWMMELSLILDESSAIILPEIPLVAWYYPDTKKSASHIYHGNLMEKWTSPNSITKQIRLVRIWTYRARVIPYSTNTPEGPSKTKPSGVFLSSSTIKRNRQISRRMDTHGIIVVERFATFHYY